MRFRDRVDPEHELARLADRIISLLNKPLPSGSLARYKMLETAISTQEAKISDYLASSFGFKEYATFEVCVDEMARIVKHTFAAHDSAEDNSLCNLCKTVRNQILEQLRDTALRTIDDPWTPNVIVAAIESVHSKTEAERLKSRGGEDLLEALAAIGMFAAERRLDVTARDVALGMGALGTHILRTYMETPSAGQDWLMVPYEAVDRLGELGKASTIRHLEWTPLQVDSQISSLGKTVETVASRAVSQIEIIGKAAIEAGMPDVVRAAATSIAGIVESTGREAAIKGVRAGATLGRVAIHEGRPDDAGVAVRCLFDIGTRDPGAPDYIRQEVVKGLVVIHDQAAGTKQLMTTAGARAIPESLEESYRGVKGVDLRLVESFAEAARAAIPVAEALNSMGTIAAPLPAGFSVAAIDSSGACGLDGQTGPSQVREAHHGRPVSWVAVSIIIIGFVVGGIAMVVGPAWWLFWTGVGIVVIGGIFAWFGRILDDWY